MAILSGPKLERLERHLASLLDSATLRRRGGIAIPHLIRQAEPLGSRLHLAREPVASEIGGIVIPESVKDAYPMTIGWIVAAGPERVQFDVATPEEVLGIKVMVGQYSGGPIHAEFGGSNLYFGDFLSINEAEVWAVLPDDLGLTR